jgi:hypothetical protein
MENLGFAMRPDAVPQYFYDIFDDIYEFFAYI